MELPEDFVDAAEAVIRALAKPDWRNPDKMTFDVTTSKLRTILSMVNDIYNDESTRREEDLEGKSLRKIQMMRIRILYDAGRDEKVKVFIEKSLILRYLLNMGKSRQKFLNFAHYMEALVAYHRYFGGRDGG